MRKLSQISEARYSVLRVILKMKQLFHFPALNPSTPKVAPLGCGAAEATGPGFVCFAVINPCVLSANRVDLVFLFHNFQFYPPPQAPTKGREQSDHSPQLLGCILLILSNKTPLQRKE